MDNGKVIRTGEGKETYNRRLGFLFKKISISRMSLVYWLTIPEFESEMLARLDNGETINNQVVCESMKRIYSKWEWLRENSEEKPDFNYSLARRGIHQIEKSMSEGH